MGGRGWGECDVGIYRKESGKDKAEKIGGSK